MQWEIDTKHTAFSAKSYHSFLSFELLCGFKGIQKMCVLHLAAHFLRLNAKVMYGIWVSVCVYWCVHQYINWIECMCVGCLDVAILATFNWSNANERARRQLFIRLGRMLDCVRVSQTKCNYCDERLKGNHIISFTCTGDAAAAAASSINFDPFANVSEYESLFSKWNCDFTYSKRITSLLRIEQIAWDALE